MVAFALKREMNFGPLVQLLEERFYLFFMGEMDVHGDRGVFAGTTLSGADAGAIKIRGVA